MILVIIDEICPDFRIEFTVGIKAPCSKCNWTFFQAVYSRVQVEIEIETPSLLFSLSSLIFAVC